MKKKKKIKRGSRHHIIPRSRGGTSKLENISKLKVKPHQFYHALFSNRTPDEIIKLLVDDFWNGDWSYVEKSYNKEMIMDLNNMVNVYSGRMTADETSREIKQYMNCKKPKKILMSLNRNDKIGGFYLEVYISDK